MNKHDDDLLLIRYTNTTHPTLPKFAKSKEIQHILATTDKRRVLVSPLKGLVTFLLVLTTQYVYKLIGGNAMMSASDETLNFESTVSRYTESFNLLNA